MKCACTPRHHPVHPRAGTVKWFNLTKGFGFITPDDATHPDGALAGDVWGRPSPRFTCPPNLLLPVAVFVHQTAIQANGFRLVREGERVAFEVAKSERGVQAISVTTEDGKPFDRTGEEHQGGGGGGYGGGGGGFSRGPREGGFQRRDGGGGGYRSGPPRERREGGYNRGGDGESQ